MSVSRAMPIQATSGPRMARQCSTCGGMAGLQIVRLLWRGHEPIDCWLCYGCWSALRRRRVLAVTLRALGAVVGVAAALVAAFAIPGYFVLRANPSERQQMLLVGLVAAGAALAGLVAVLRAAAIRLPAPLRFGRRPGAYLFALPLGQSPQQADVTLRQQQRADQVQADEIARCIESGQTNYRLARLCGSLPAALATFAGYQTARHGPAQTTADCCVCGRRDDLRLAEWTWESPPGGERTATPLITVLLLLAGHLHFSTGKRERFVTYHRFCRACLRRAHWRRRLQGLVLAPAAMLLIVAGGLGMLVGVTVALGQRNRDMSRQGWWLVIPAVVLLLLGIVLLRYFRARRVPLPLRGIDRAPFHPRAVRVVDCA
jgi:hypothetical protein